MLEPVLAFSIPVWLQHGIETYGYWVILVAVTLESLGVPFPGETSLLAGAIYAATTGRMSIAGVIVAAAAGAILGDNIGYSIGLYGGYPLARKITTKLRLGDGALTYAQGFFAKHGNKTVFFGRFFSLLRLWVAFLAGVNRMPRLSFLFWNAFGGIVWAIIYGELGFLLGHNVSLLDQVLGGMGVAGIVAIVAFVALVIAARIVLRRRQKLKRQLASQASAEPSADAARDAPTDRSRVS
ncbi:MAG: DedA family protein [Ktedonobacterales bacterium]